MAESDRRGLDLRDGGLPVTAVVAALGLQPHPEGGWYRETWRDAPEDGSRGAGTAILFLLAADRPSHWHRVDAAELWIWQAGAPLALHLSPDGRSRSTLRLGPLPATDRLHGLVLAGQWQAAESLGAVGGGAWTLVTCTVTPAFAFAGFEMAPAGWAPGG